MTDLLQRFPSDALPGHANRPPKDAATLILLDRSGPTPKVLMGKRHHGHVFLPGKFVFPGGSVDPADRRMTAGAPLDPRAEAKADAARSAGRARPRRRRWRSPPSARRSKRPGCSSARSAAGHAKAPAGAWQAFAEANIHPDLSTVHFIARAITPPRRARRYDTRFFTADASAIAHRIEGKVGPDAELVELVWVPLDGIKEKIDLLAITEIVLGDLDKQHRGRLQPRPSGAVLPGAARQAASAELL